jgi:hypothetical protein
MKDEQRARRFAELNGWKLSKSSFGLRLLAGLPRKRGALSALDDLHPGNGQTGRLFDHCSFYRMDRVPVAIVSQPYAEATTIEQARAKAAVYALEVLTPPLSPAGWHYPGRTEMFVFVRRGTPVSWLPEQIEPAMFERFKTEYEAEQSERMRLYNKRTARITARKEAQS